MRSLGLFGSLIFITLFSFPAMAKEYDVVIQNGRVMDPETSFDAVRNVGINNGRIENISKGKLKGKEN